MSEFTLASRVPAESLMQALRAAIGPERPPTFSSRLFGHNPIPSSARSWYVGILGELAVADALRSLPADWLVLHSVPVGDRGANIDHVLVSPSGRVLTLNTKHSPGGRVWVSPKAILVNGQRLPYLRNSSHEAARAARLLSATTGGRVDALAVIVVAGATLTHKGQPRDVAVVTLANLLPFLTRHVAPSSGTVSAELVRHAAVRPRTWAPTQPILSHSTAHVEWFMGLRERARLAARRRTAWIVGSVVVAFAGPPLIVAIVVATTALSV